MNSENSVILRTIIIASIILAGLFTLIFLLEDNLTNYFGKYGSHVATGLKLLSLWLVVGSAVRSIHSLEKKSPSWKLLTSGTITPALAILLFTAFQFLYQPSEGRAVAGNPAISLGTTIVVMIALGFIAALLATINTRVRNRHLGNLLELIVVLSAIALFVYYVTQ